MKLREYEQMMQSLQMQNQNLMHQLVNQQSYYAPQIDAAHQNTTPSLVGAQEIADSDSEQIEKLENDIHNQLNLRFQPLASFEAINPDDGSKTVTSHTRTVRENQAFTEELPSGLWQRNSHITQQ